MSTSPPEMPQDWTQPSQKRGMSSGAKVLLILAIVFGGLAVLCCGGVIGVVYYFRQAMTEDPAAIRAKAAEITEIDIPDGLQPQMAIDMKVPFSGQPFMTMVVYGDPAAKSSLILASVGQAFGAQSQAEMEQSIDQSLQRQGMGEQGEVVIGQTVQKEIQIRGQKVTFTITNGKGARSGKPRISVKGSFPGKEGATMLRLNADADKYPEEKIVRMLESIR